MYNIYYYRRCRTACGFKERATGDAYNTTLSDVVISVKTESTVVQAAVAAGV